MDSAMGYRLCDFSALLDSQRRKMGYPAHLLMPFARRGAFTHARVQQMGNIAHRTRHRQSSLTHSETADKIN